MDRTLLAVQKLLTSHNGETNSYNFAKIAVGDDYLINQTFLMEPNYPLCVVYGLDDYYDNRDSHGGLGQGECKHVLPIRVRVFTRSWIYSNQIIDQGSAQYSAMSLCRRVRNVLLSCVRLGGQLTKDELSGDYNGIHINEHTNMVNMLVSGMEPELRASNTPFYLQGGGGNDIFAVGRTMVATYFRYENIKPSRHNN